MILAAGFGSRLKPLTDSIPKALVPFGNGTLISYQIEKLKSIGIKSITVNTHHLSEQIIEYIKTNNFDVEIEVIKEDSILGTGGGILNAEKNLKKSGNFLVINVDVYTDFDMNLLKKENLNKNSIATLLVQKRKTSRYLEFSENLELISRIRTEEPLNNYYAFNGIQVISDRIFDFSHPKGYFDILDFYLSIIKEGKAKVKGLDCGASKFFDLGKIEVLNKFGST